MPPGSTSTAALSAIVQPVRSTGSAPALNTSTHSKAASRDPMPALAKISVMRSGGSGSVASAGGSRGAPARASSLARNPWAPAQASPRRGASIRSTWCPAPGDAVAADQSPPLRDSVCPRGRRREDHDRAVAAPRHPVHRLPGRVDQQHAITGVRQRVADPSIRHDDELHVPRQLLRQRLAAPDDQVRTRGQRRGRDRVPRRGCRPAASRSGRSDPAPGCGSPPNSKAASLRAASGGGADLRDLGTGRRLGKHPGRRGRRRSDLRRQDATGAQQREGARHARPPRPASAPTPAGPDTHDDSFVRRRAGWRSLGLDVKQGTRGGGRALQRAMHDHPLDDDGSRCGASAARPRPGDGRGVPRPGSRAAPWSSTALVPRRRAQSATAAATITVTALRIAGTSGARSDRSAGSTAGTLGRVASIEDDVLDGDGQP